MPRKHNPHHRSRELARLATHTDSPYHDHVTVLAIFNDGEHYRLECCGIRFDYWPSTGRWFRIPRSRVGTSDSGIHGLVRWAQIHQARPRTS